MKKILAFILCAFLLCATPIVAFAADDSAGAVAEEVIEENITTPETETPTEEEIQPPMETPEEPRPTLEEEVDMVTKEIEEWLMANIEEIGVIITLIGYGIVILTRVRALIKSTGTINNNAITISKASSEAIAKALANMENASGAVVKYDSRILELLEAFKNTAEDKAMLERELVEIKNYLKVESKSVTEMSNEIAELIGLSNIPIYKKDELGSRHVAAVNAIIEAERTAEIEADNAARRLLPSTEEVKEDVGEKS